MGGATTGVSPPTSPSAARGRTAPVDYTFKELKQCEDVCFEEPVSGVAAHPPVPRDTNLADYLDGLQAANSPPARRGPTSLRLGSNPITTLKGLDRAAWHVFADPSILTWLDVSCCKLTHIEEVIVTSFPKLQMLYMHGNLIASLAEVPTLAPLQHLQKLTLHGCPVAEKKDYKLWVCMHLPGLRALDFSSITKLERDTVQVFQRAKQAAAATD